MSDRRMNITRRKVLGALGAVGAAGAGAGFGTSALFNDTETFENNSLTAGTLDLKVDWEEHYYNGGASPENGESIDSLRRVDGSSDVGSSEVGLPDPQNPVVAVAEGDLAAFMTASTEESGGPTDNPDPGPIELIDVKPGDFGEVTFSYHLFDNPGYVRLEAEVLVDDENSVTEPESDADPNNTTPAPNADIDGEGELGDEVQAALWYDPDCDNVLDDESETVLQRGTLNEVLDFLGASGGTPPVLDPTESGGRVADGYSGTKCHGTVNSPGGPPFECSERLYMTNTVDDPEQNPGDDPFGSPSDDTTKLYEVDIAGGDAELTEIFDFNNDISIDEDTDGVGDYNHIVSMAASPDGTTIYVIDKFTKRLGKYDVAGDSFTDLGEISGAPNTSLQAAVAPDGKLYFTVFGESDLYVINDPDTNTSVDSTIPLTDSNGDPIEVGGSDIAFLSNGTLYLFDAKDAGGTPDLYKIPDPSTGSAELVGELPTDVSLPGLAVRAAGDGNLIGSDSEGDQLYELDPTDGSMVATYEMDELGGAGTDFDHMFGDMTAGPICPEHCVALAWWVPRDVGNEIQSDSIEFGLTFRTEQCRNNPTPFQ